MRNNLYYSVINFRKKFLFNLFLILLVAFSLFFIHKVGVEFQKTLETEKEIERIRSLDDVYAVLSWYTAKGQANENSNDMTSEGRTFIDDAVVHPEKYGNYSIETYMLNSIVSSKDPIFKKDDENYVKMLLITEGLYKKLPLKVKIGENFNDQAYNGVKKNSYKVLAGSDYADQFKIGDLINMKSEEAEYEFEIIGFLEEKQIISKDLTQGDIDYSDEYFVVAFKRSLDTGSWGLPDFLYHGHLVMTKDKDKVEQTFNFERQKAGMHNTEFELVPPGELNQKLGLEREAVSTNLIVIALSMLVFSIISILSSVFSTFRKQKYVIAIFILNGADRKDLFEQVFFEKLFILLFSYCTYLITSVFLEFNSVVYLVNFGIVIGLILINMMIIKIKVKRMSVIKYIKVLGE